jgi:hypothetical protein
MVMASSGSLGLDSYAFYAVAHKIQTRECEAVLSYEIYEGISQ